MPADVVAVLRVTRPGTLITVRRGPRRRLGRHPHFDRQGKLRRLPAVQRAIQVKIALADRHRCTLHPHGAEAPGYHERHIQHPRILPRPRRPVPAFPANRIPYHEFRCARRFPGPTLLAGIHSSPGYCFRSSTSRPSRLLYGNIDHKRRYSWCGTWPGRSSDQLSRRASVLLCRSPALAASILSGRVLEPVFLQTAKRKQ